MVSTAHVLFHRFSFQVTPLEAFAAVEDVAMACTFLAAKVEEVTRRTSAFINVFHHLTHTDPRLILPESEVFSDSVLPPHYHEANRLIRPIWMHEKGLSSWKVISCAN